MCARAGDIKAGAPYCILDELYACASSRIDLTVGSRELRDVGVRQRQRKEWFGQAGKHSPNVL